MSIVNDIIARDRAHDAKCEAIRRVDSEAAAVQPSKVAARRPKMTPAEDAKITKAARDQIITNGRKRGPRALVTWGELIAVLDALDEGIASVERD